MLIMRMDRKLSMDTGPAHLSAAVRSAAANTGADAPSDAAFSSFVPGLHPFILGSHPKAGLLGGGWHGSGGAGKPSGTQTLTHGFDRAAHPGVPWLVWVCAPRLPCSKLSVGSPFQAWAPCPVIGGDISISSQTVRKG